MKTLSRPLRAAVAGLALFSMAGCAQGGSTEGDSDKPPAPAGAALAKVDPCKIMTPEQLTSAGLPTQGEAIGQFDFEPACNYSGDVATITLSRNATTTLDALGGQSNWGEFTKIDVNGRPAARAKNAGATDDMCSTIVSAGGGVVSVDALAADPRKPFDGCAESLKIAQQIEPSLPK